MDITKFTELFAAFGKAPMEEFLELLFEGVPIDLKNRLIIEDVSYHRHSAEIVTLEVWMVFDSLDSNRWTWVKVEMDPASGDIKDYYYTKDSYSRQSLPSLKACLDSYRKTD